MLSALWGLLGLITIVALFVVYANFPESSRLRLPELGLDIAIDRHNYFFTFSGLYLTINIVLYLAIRAANNLKKVFQSVQTLQHLRTMVAVKILAIGANLFLMSLIVYAKMIIESQGLLSGNWFLMLLGPLIMIAGLGYLFYVLLKPHREHDAVH